MEYVEPRQATIRLDEIIMNGTLSGTVQSVKFESDDETFLQYFPTGSFDSLYIEEKNLTQTQQDIIEVARDLIRLALKH